jgi:hypothetical protein
MKKLHLFFTLSFLLISVFAIAQNDKIYLHNKQQLEVKILKVSDKAVSFTYPNETAEQTLGRYAIAKIIYSSGRTEEISDKVVVTSKDDWENVVVVDEKEAVLGLKNIGEVRGKTNGVFSYHTAASADKKSLKKLKEDAAEIGASFVLITSDKDNQFSRQSIKTGTAYTY